MAGLGTAVVACGAAADISANPVNGQVVYFTGKELRSCDPSGGGCSSLAQLDFEPVAVAVGPDSKIFLLGKQSVRICDSNASCSTTMALPFSNPAGLTVGPSGKAIVVSSTGAVALCDGGACSLR